MYTKSFVVFVLSPSRLLDCEEGGGWIFSFAPHNTQWQMVRLIMLSAESRQSYITTQTTHVPFGFMLGACFLLGEVGSMFKANHGNLFEFFL